MSESIPLVGWFTPDPVVINGVSVPINPIRRVVYVQGVKLAEALASEVEVGLTPPETAPVVSVAPVGSTPDVAPQITVTSTVETPPASIPSEVSPVVIETNEIAPNLPIVVSEVDTSSSVPTDDDWLLASMALSAPSPPGWESTDRPEINDVVRHGA